MIGLGRMGGNMARRLLRHGFQVIGYDHDPQALQVLEQEGLTGSSSLSDAVQKAKPPRLVWLMLPAGQITESTLEALIPLLSPGDLVVDGGNAYYEDSLRRAQLLKERGLHFADVGVSGGIWGLENGYGLMMGASPEDATRIEPLLKALAPAPDRGWVHAGPVGAGHFTKMVHNGIEYGMMQALAEGLEIVRKKEEFHVNLPALAEAWRYGTVIRSWLLDLTAEALAEDPELKDVAPVVADSGEGRWTVLEAVRLGVSAPVITHSLYRRFESQDQEGFAAKLLAMMRKGFGGHKVVRRD
jgi:6-phosphogluconate dehydrogenase